MTSPSDLQAVARSICCPSGVCGKGDGEFAICQAHTWDKEADAALSTIQAQALGEAGAWNLDMASAPKDRPIQLYSSERNQQVVAFWGTAIEDLSGEWVYARQLNFAEPENAIAFVFRDPTAWRECPAPPTPIQTEGEG